MATIVIGSTTYTRPEQSITIRRTVPAIAYLLLARFGTSYANPIPSSLTIDTGGPLTVVEHANSDWSISGGQLLITVSGATDARVTGPSHGARVAGRTLLFDYQFDATNHGVMASMQHIYAAATIENFKIYQGEIRVGDWQVSLPALLANTRYYIAMIYRTAGNFVFLKGGAYTSWTLIYVYSFLTSSLAAYLEPFHAGATANHQYDNLRVVDIGPYDSRFSTDYGYATARTATTAANDTITMTADAIIEHTIVAATGVTQELMVRRTDDNNCWIIRMAQGTSTCKLVQKQAGVETERATAAQTWTNAASYRIVAICYSNTIHVFVTAVASPNNPVQQNYYASASFNNTATGVKVSHAGTNLISWPRIPSPTLPGV